MKCFSLKCLLFTTALLLAGYHSNSQIISTVVGNGTAGYSGDGAAATLAQLSGTPGVAVDNSGNIFIADLGNNCIRKVNAAGIISTYAGTTVPGFSGDNGPATAAQINHPIGIRLDKHGNLYICDELNHRVRKVNTAGIITTIAGTGTGATSGDGGPATAAELLMPGGIVIDTNDNVYITCSPVPAVRKIDAVTGIINTFAGTGTPGYSGDGAAATAALISGPTGITLDSVGNVYFADYNNHCIRKVTPAGIITTCAGTGTVSGYSGDGGAATMAKMYRPTDVAVKNGSLYIVDNWNNCIRVVNAAGTISTYAGDTASGYSGDGGPATAARLSRPFSIDANNLGDVFVSDLNNSCVRKITNVSSLATPEIFTSDRALVVYPNPFQSEITITVKSIKSEAEVSVYLINAIGQNFRSTTALLKNGSLRVDLTDIPSGIYMLFVENPNTGTVLKQKIIKL